MSTAQAETLEFRAELKQLLHLITHSLYSNKEIFLRELISNASDAINKIKFDSLQHEDRLEGNKDWKIKVVADKQAGTLTLSDNGIGMDRAGAVRDLGTIAHSGTRAFLESLKQAGEVQRPDLIGQFGVGFYSAFMVADRVTVVSRMAGNPTDGVRWESDGQGAYSVENVEKPTRGTDVVLHLKESEKEFLEPYRLRGIIKKFSDFIEHPVVMDVEREKEGQKTVEEEAINARKAIWLRSKSENTAEEYATFYKQISHDFDPPARVVHYGAEGVHEFKALLFVPGKLPLSMQWGEYNWGLKLYVQRVLIMEHCQAVLPPYLRFVQGVVDSSDLPLNISRELLQEDRKLEQIRNSVVKNVLKALEEMKADEYEKYVTFHREMGGILKEGLGRDFANRERIADLLLFESLKTPAGAYTTLAKYVEAMPADQPAIYYLIGEDRALLEGSPYLEAHRAKGHDVLLLTDPVDEFAIPALHQYKEKKLERADQAEVDGQKADESIPAEVRQRYQPLLDFLKGRLTELGDVRLTSRLKESAACLVAGEGGMSAHLERFMQRIGRGEDVPASKRTLELNPVHPVVEAMQRLHSAGGQEGRVEAYGRLLLDQATLAEGSRLKDVAGFARRLNEVLGRDALA